MSSGISRSKAIGINHAELHKTTLLTFEGLKAIPRNKSRFLVNFEGNCEAYLFCKKEFLILKK